MVFSSSLFLLYFFPVFLIAYLLTPVKFKNYTILVASVLFYAWGAPKFIFVLFAVLVADYFLGNKIYESEGRKRKLYLIISILINVGMLLYFKYSNFFVENLNDVLHLFNIENVSWTKVVLPIGISFFTFQEMSYTIDIYRGEHKPLQKFTDYMLFIFMFSHLIAGPIVTYHILADDIVDRRHQLNNDYRLLGLYRFIIGLAKKVLIANVLGEVADAIFKLQPAEINSTTAWLGITAYTFQLYFDFSGYSDMAIGIGKFLGFNFPENFNSPYISQSITEFWKRWHMTLSSWMKNYLYIPLGGNKVSVIRMFLNLWIVFLISGFWHGAEWTFIVWGAYHGFFIVLDKVFLIKLLKQIGKIPRTIFTFIVAMVGWVFFRSSDLSYAIGFIKKMFSFQFSYPEIIYSNRFEFTMVLAIIFSFAALSGKIAQWQWKGLNISSSNFILTGRVILSISLFILALADITSSGFNPFIYFRF